MSTDTGKVVVNRAMSLDGFIAGPGHTMDWGAGRPLADFVAPEDLQEIAAVAMVHGHDEVEGGEVLAADLTGPTRQAQSHALGCFGHETSFAHGFGFPGCYSAASSGSRPPARSRAARSS